MQDAPHCKQIALGELVGEEVSRACQHVVDELGQDDSPAAWKYNDTIQNLSGFSRDKPAMVNLREVGPNKKRPSVYH